MVNFKDLYKKYVNYIVVILIIILGLKSCQSCSRSNQIKYNDYIHTLYCDSIDSVLISRDHTIDSLNNELNLYKYKVTTLQETNLSLKDVTKNIKETNTNLSIYNKNLSNTNSKLINKEIKKEKKK